MAAKKYNYVVSGAAAVVRTVDGSERYFYRGALLPAGLDEESVKHCVAAGLVSRVEVKASTGDAASGDADGAAGK